MAVFVQASNHHKYNPLKTIVRRDSVHTKGKWRKVNSENERREKQGHFFSPITFPV